MKTLGNVFREYRKRKDITQKELSILMKCSIVTVGKIETNKYTAGEKILNKFLILKDVNKEEKEFILNYREMKKNVYNTEKKKKEPSENDYRYEDMLKIKAVLSEYATTNRLVKVMWDFREILFKYFQEIDLLLSTNEFKTNKKMEKGILKVSSDLDDMSKKIKKYVTKEIREAQIL